MKKRIFTVLLVTTFILTVLIPNCVLADANASGAVTIDGILAAGTLHSRVQALDGIDSPMDVTSLTITATGSLDPGDIAYINAMINLTRLDVDTTITCTDAGDNFLTSFKNLIYVKFPAVTYGDSAFSDQTTFDTNLVEVNLPNATTFGEQAFYEREGLTTVSLPKAKTFGGGAFSACRGLSSISLPEATTFDTYAFTDCSSLTSVSLPKAESFGFSAFNCSALTNLSLPEATTFNGFAFDGANNLTTISTPKATSFGDEIFGMGPKTNVVTWTLGSTPPSVTFSTGVPAAGSIVRVPASAVSTYDSNGDGKWNGWTIQALPIAVASMEVLPATASVVMGDTTSLTANVLPANAANKDVAWSSSNESVATVSSSGVVSGVSVGTATITATTDDGGFTDDCVVTVQPIAATGVQVLPATASINIGETKNLTATVSPNNATNKDVAWSSSNESVATVSSSGVVSAVSVGTATITATTDDGGLTDDCVVTVLPIAATGVEVLPATASINIGGTKNLTATVSPNNATNKNVTWNSSNESVATVSSNGVVTGILAGTATITATTADGGFTDNCVVTVLADDIDVTDVEVLPAAASIGIGGTKNLTATVLPNNATNKNVTWSSSNESVATVSSSGVVTGILAGTATITATTADGGFTDNCVVTVLADDIDVTGIEVLPATASLSVGGTKHLTATVSPNNATNKDFTWSSSNESVATISSNGVVTGVSAGTATITATTADGGFTDSCAVTIKADSVAVTGIEVTPESAAVAVGETQTLTAKVTPSCAANKDVTWTSSNNSIATVDSKGVVTAVSKGDVIIIATSNDNSSLSGSCQLAVEEPASQKGTVEGKLVDDKGNPLVGYTVVLNSNPITTVTNSEGKFKFTDVPLTVHRLDIKNSAGVELTQYNLDFTKGNTAVYTTEGQDIDITYTSTTASIVLGFEFDGDSTVTFEDLSFVENPKTGDDSTMIIFIAIGILGIIITLLAVWRCMLNKSKI